ncbi:MAG: CoA transferase [Betaproteobacteria bacterium]|nr:MAG: CoA transferase [Betaproteobacteria bacterium]
MTSVLEGIRVLDFGRYIAGPYCAELLAHFGADVIRIEKLGGSEDRYTTPVTEDGQGALFFQMNCNKRGMTLNPTKPEGREVVKRLVRTADVVVASLPHATLVEMGIDYASLKAIKEDIILTMVSTFGSLGPYSERVGFDGIAQVMSGATYIGGFPGQPMKSYAPYADYGTATSAALGTLAALIARQRTGRGQIVEGALLRTALAYANGVMIEQILLGVDRVGTGNRSQISAPSDIFKTRDGAIIIQVLGQPLFERWARLVGADAWIGDARFATDAERGRNGELISARAGAWCAERTTAEALLALEEARVPAGPVLSPQQAHDDPHVRAMGILNSVDYPGLPKAAPVVGTPVLLSETPGRITRRPPTLGEHTDEVMTEIGYNPEDIAALRARRVI